MMIIKSNEHTLIIPVYRGLHLIHEMNCKYELLECLNSYFALKKKTKCIIMDDDHELINPKDVQFVYISSKEDISSIFDFKYNGASLESNIFLKNNMNSSNIFTKFFPLVS